MADNFNFHLQSSSPFDEDDSFAFEDHMYGYHGSGGEETEEASEAELNTRRHDKEFTEIKEQMYQDKLAQLKKQLQQLQEGTLPEYLRRLKRIEQQYKERLRVNEMWQEVCIENAEHSYEMEKTQNKKEFELKKVDLKERLISDWEDKKRQVENDKIHMELSMDFIDFKPISTRKLRRRLQHDGNVVSSNGTQEKKRKQSPTINILLDDVAINEDLKLINKVSGRTFANKRQPTPANNHSTEEPVSCDARIEDGKLYFEKRWYLRGQAIYADSKETGKFGATINNITNAEIWIKKTSDNSKMKILLTQLQKGKYTIRRRST